MVRLAAAFRCCGSHRDGLQARSVTGFGPIFGVDFDESVDDLSVDPVHEHQAPMRRRRFVAVEKHPPGRSAAQTPPTELRRRMADRETHIACGSLQRLLFIKGQVPTRLGVIETQHDQDDPPDEHTVVDERIVDKGRAVADEEAYQNADNADQHVQHRRNTTPAVVRKKIRLHHRAGVEVRGKRITDCFVSLCFARSVGDMVVVHRVEPSFNRLIRGQQPPQLATFQLALQKQWLTVYFQGMCSELLPRAIAPLVEDALRRNPVVALIGARQSGKTTLARQFVAAGSPNYFDLEDPLSLARLDEPMTALGPLRGIVVIDEVQRRPELFPMLRVLADRDDNPARFLVLGSAGPELLRQSAESLAGRIEYLELTGLQAAELAAEHMTTLWLRGGFPRSLLADSDEDSLTWRKSYVQTFVERDLPQFGAGLSAPTIHRLMLMLAHYHGQIVNVRALATALGVSETTVRRYLDLLEQLFLIRQLRPWHENLRKRQVKRPKLYFRDSGLFHHLTGAGTMDELLTNPRLGASWEGFILEKTLAEARPDHAYFWGTHGGAELDLLLFVRGRRIGVEIKRADAPRRTPSMTAALGDLSLDALCVLYPGDLRYEIGQRITAVPAAEFFSVD